MSKPKDNNQNQSKITEDVEEHLKEQISDDDFETLKNDFNDLQSRFGDMENQLKRAVADYQNLEKRVEEGRLEFANWANTELIKKILQTVNLLEKALDGATQEERESGWFKGVAMSVKQLLQVLKDEGLEQIRADGQFDPALHEAVDTKEGDDNKILEVTEKGYTLNGKILKPAKVVVGRNSK